MRRTIKITSIILLVVALASLGFYFLILDHEGKPFCHKQIMIGLQLSIQDEDKTKSFPNVNGKSRESLEKAQSDIGSFHWAGDYNYLPGLMENDPGHLVLMYVNKPTRWTWHGECPTIFREKSWILLPVDFKMGNRPNMGPGENSEKVSSEEFKNRLKQTLDFIRTNQRPHWESIVAEHQRFLDSMTSN